MSDYDNWVTLHSHKLCPHLQKKIGATYEHSSWLPSFLRKPVTFMKQRLTKQRIIIQFKEDSCTGLLSAGSKKIMGCKVEGSLDIVNGFATRATVNTLKQLLASDQVAAIWQDREVKAVLDVATPTVQAPRVWRLGKEGKGVGIAIIDTGIHPHPDLIYPQNRIVAFKDFVKGKTTAYDDNGHGTHCAGDAAGNGYKSGGKFRGPAPKAKLIGVKVLDKHGSGLMSKIIAGIQWCVENRNKYGIKVLSLSLGAQVSGPSKTDPLCKAVKAAWDKGLVVCAAAGNDGPGERTINSPGVEPAIITVGAVDDKGTAIVGDNVMAGFSSRGPTYDGFIKPDLVAPGVRISSLRSPNSYFDKNNKGARIGEFYTVMSGTSMATPVCAGVVALLLEAVPGLKPTEVKRLLVNGCQSLGAAQNVQGAGLINAEASLKKSKSFGKVKEF